MQWLPGELLLRDSEYEYSRPQMGGYVQGGGGLVENAREMEDGWMQVRGGGAMAGGVIIPKKHEP